MKAGTFTQLYIHLIFAVKYRQAILNKNFRPRVFEYISGIITQMNHKSIIVNGFSDHVHILIGLNPSNSISDTVHDIKRSSSLFINKESLCIGRFSWQDGYGAFSYSRSQLEMIYSYIYNQESHHEKNSFREEYLEVLKNFSVNYEEKYLFDFFEL
jgi:REP element-mobilizing transposase RayT